MRYSRAEAAFGVRGRGVAGMTHDEASAFCWVKSSHSNGNGGNCVEVGLGYPGHVVPLQDSKLADSPLVVGGVAFWAFPRGLVPSR